MTSSRYGEKPLADGMNRPCLHQVDSGVSNNAGMCGVLDALQLLEALHAAGIPTQLDRLTRKVVIVAHSCSSHATARDASEEEPGVVAVLLQSTGVPVDHYSYEADELPKDMAELDCQYQQPTSFVLPPEAVDRLRAAAGTIIAASPEFQRMLKDAGVKVVGDPTGAP